MDRVIRETGEVLANGFEEVYVNAKVKDGSEVSELMEVFVDAAGCNSKFPVTSSSKCRYKETEEGFVLLQADGIFTCLFFKDFIKIR